MNLVVVVVVEVEVKVELEDLLSISPSISRCFHNLQIIEYIFIYSITIYGIIFIFFTPLRIYTFEHCNPHNVRIMFKGNVTNSPQRGLSSEIYQLKRTRTLRRAVVCELNLYRTSNDTCVIFSTINVYF